MSAVVLTREQILAMPAGPELDALVAERVMGGWPVNPDGVVPRRRSWAPSTDIAAAWEVVEHVTATPIGGPWIDATKPENGIDVEFTAGCKASGDTLPLAICRAALLATLQDAE